jgi:hypothetical protein
MTDADRSTLRRTYRTPRVRVGAVLFCEARGRDMIVTGMTAAPVRWPVGRTRGEPGWPAPIVCGGLAAAVRREAAQAVARAWGVSRQTVSKWRRELGVGPPADVRARRAEAARARAKGRPLKGRAWTAAEDEAVRTLPPAEAARQTGRPIKQVYGRRFTLRVPRPPGGLGQ